MKKVLATTLALVSLLTSSAIIANANEDNSNNGTLVEYDSNPSMLTRLNNLVTISPSSEVKSCLDFCSKSSKDCLRTSPESPENQYNSCTDVFDSCLKKNCLKTDKKDKEKFFRIIGDFDVLTYFKVYKLSNDTKNYGSIISNKVLSLAGCSKDAIACAFKTPSVKCFSDFKDCVIK